MNQQIIVWIAGIAAALLGAPLLPGVINRVKAFYAGRRGPSLWQLYYDLRKLRHKQSVYSGSCTWIFQWAPAANCAVLLASMLLLPFAGVRSPFGFAGDLMLFIYLSGTGRFFTVLGALDTASSFEGMGASRECQFAVTAEAAAVIVFASLVILTGELSLSGLLLRSDLRLWTAESTALLLIGAAFFIVILAECCRVPVDDPDTHLELTMIHEAMILDNSGPDLALIHYAASLKMWLLLLVETKMLSPRVPGGPWAELGVEILGVLAGALLIGTAESVLARFRFRKVPQFLAAAAGTALLAAVLLVLFQN